MGHYEITVDQGYPAIVCTKCKTKVAYGLAGAIPMTIAIETMSRHHDKHHMFSASG